MCCEIAAAVQNIIPTFSSTLARLSAGFIFVQFHLSFYVHQASLMLNSFPPQLGIGKMCYLSLVYMDFQHMIVNLLLIKFCRVRAVHPAKVSGPPSMPKSEAEQSSEIHHATEEFMDNGKNLCVAVMSSKPILALKFSCMKMQVEAPVVVPNSFNNSLATS